MRLLLWAVFVVAVPVPLLIPVQGEVPAARILMLAAIGLLQMLTETTRGAVVQLTLLFLGQALLATAALWVVAYVVSRLVQSLAPAAQAVVAVAIVVALLATALTREIYRDPFRAATPRANLIDVYE